MDERIHAGKTPPMNHLWLAQFRIASGRRWRKGGDGGSAELGAVFLA